MRGAADGLPTAAANVARISAATSGESQFCVDPAYRASLGSRKSWKLRDYLVAFHIEARPFIYLGSAYSLSLGNLSMADVTVHLDDDLYEKASRVARLDNLSVKE